MNKVQSTKHAPCDDTGYKVKIKHKEQSTSCEQIPLVRHFGLACSLSFVLWNLFLLCSLFFVLFSIYVPAANAAVSKNRNFKDLRPTAINSYSAAVIDEETGELLLGKRENIEKPVASITKIVSAYVYLDKNPDLEKKAKMEQEDEVGGGRLKLPIGTTAKIKDFLYSSLIGSANNSATALMRLSNLSKNSFIDKMNDLAKESGAADAKFVDACGISPNNRASAKELALIGEKVFSNSKICQIAARKKYSFNFNNGKGTKTVAHTSPLVGRKNNSFKILAAKTGYLPEIGNNLIVKLQSKKDSKAKIIVVLMGAKNQGSTTLDATKIGKWAFKNYTWK